MSTRNFLLSLFSFGAVACLPLPASSTDLPKEGTRHVDTQFKGRVDGDKSSTVGADRIEAWDETRVVTLNCGQTQWPAIKEERCFGIDELIGAFRYSTGYCLDTDEDGDKILWKCGPRKKWEKF